MMLICYRFLFLFITKLTPHRPLFLTFPLPSTSRAPPVEGSTLATVGFAMP